MSTPIPEDVGRRIKAALELAGLASAEELAKKVNRKGWGPRTIRKMWDPEDDSRQVQASDLQTISDATGVALWFFYADLQRDHSDPGIALRLQALEDAVPRRLEAIEEDVTLLLEAAGAQAPEGELAQHIQDALTNRRNRERHDSPGEPGAPGGNGGS